MERLQRFALWVLQPKVGLPLALLLLLASSPFVYRASRLSSLPNCGHPFDVDAFCTQEVPDENNASVEYREAENLYKEPSFNTADDESLDKAMEEDWSEANTNVRKWAADNRAAMEVWRRGTKKPDALYIQPKEVNFSTLSSDFHTAREYARLARLEEVGDLDGAWGWYLAIFRSSRHFGKRGLMLERILGMSIYSVAAQAIAKWATIGELKPQQLQQAMNDIQAAYAMSAPLSVNYKWEYLCFENTIVQFTLSEVIEIEREIGDDFVWAADMVLFIQNEPEVGRRLMRQGFANWLVEVDKPLHERQPQVPGNYGFYQRDPTLVYRTDSLPPEKIEELASRSMVAWFLLSATSGVDIIVTREQARQAALIAMLALRVHQLETGHLPDTLDELVEDGILEAVLIDP